jgi:hypothetical protein
MKALITFAKFIKEKPGQYGMQYLYEISYNEKKGIYYSKKSDQTYFVEGMEAEFTEEERSYTDKNGKPASFLLIKPITATGKQSNYGKALNKEQARYSSFAVAYVKDLIVSGRIDIKDWETKSREVCSWMVSIDKELMS